MESPVTRSAPAHTPRPVWERHLPIIRRAIDFAIPLILFCGALVLYSITLLPGNDAASDTMKYHFIGRELGLSHPPGSPLYLMINWLVSQIPFGEQAWRINFFSAVCGALSVTFLYRLTRYLSLSRLGGATAAVLLGIAEVFWKQSVIAEIYPLFMTVLLASLYFLARWRETDRLRDYALACAFFGLSFGVHHMTAYFVPGFALFVFQGRGRMLRSPATLWVTIGGALLGMSTYLYYAIRPFFGPRFVEVRFQNPGDYFNFITGGYFRDNMFAYKPAEMFSERLPWLLREFLENLGPIALVLGIIGLVLIFRRRPRFGVMLAIAGALSSIFAMGYKVGDSQIFLLPALMTLTLGAGYCVGRLHYLPNLKPGLSKLPAVAMLVLFAILIADTRGHFVRSWSENDMRMRTGMETFAARMLARMDDDGVLITGNQRPLFAILYQEYVKGKPRHLIKHLHPGVWDGSARNLRDQLPRVSRTGNYYFTNDLAEVIHADWGLLFQRLDVSRTVPEFLATVPEGKLVALAAPANGLWAVPKRDLERLEQLGISIREAAAEGKPWAALLIRRGHRFAGIQRGGSTRVYIHANKRDELAGIVLPFDISVTAHAERARIAANHRYQCEAEEGLLIGVFDLFSRTRTERHRAATDRTGTLNEYALYAVSPLQPAWRYPLDHPHVLNEFLARSHGRLRFGMLAAEAAPVTLTLFMAGRKRPNVTIRQWREEPAGTWAGGEKRPADMREVAEGELTHFGRRAAGWIVEIVEEQVRCSYEIHINGGYRRVEGILHRGEDH